ncbi:MAG: hypothetical protein ABJG88_07810 [Litorimonas sp.]
MTFVTPHINTSSRNFIPASLSLFVCVFLSVLHINIAGESISLLLLPLLIVSLWPREVNTVVTIGTFFVIGIFLDWGTNGVLGQWAIVYLTVFAILRPNRRDHSLSFFNAVSLWCAGLAIATVMLIITGWLAYGVLPNFTTLFRQALLICAFMPVVVFTRNLVRYALMDPQDRDYL